MPFSLPQFQKQTLFYPHYRYTRDFHHSLQAVEATCLSSAKLSLHRYVLSITRDSEDNRTLDVNREDSFVSLEGEEALVGLETRCTSTPRNNLDGQKRKLSQSRREEISKHDNPEMVGPRAAGQRQKHQKINQGSASLAICNTNVDMGTVEGPGMPRATEGSLEEDPRSVQSVSEPAPVPDAGTDAEELANRLASRFISKFSEGINSLASMPKSLAHLQVQHRTQEYCIEQLVRNSEEIKKQARSLSWCYLFLAGTICSSSRSLPAQTVGEVREDCSQAKRTAIRWGGAAEVVNAVVKSLYPNWDANAYLVYHALAAKHYALSDIASLSRGKRSKVVEKIVEGLRDRQPDKLTVEWSPFDPAVHLSQFLKFEYGLSSHLPCETLR
ncbi:MAG: hypothetical protein Q9163_001187 [Psora crenata]